MKTTTKQLNDLLDAGIPEWDDQITSLQKELIASNCEREWVYSDSEGTTGRGVHKNMEEAFAAAEAQCRQHLDLIDAGPEWDTFELGVYCELTAESETREGQR